MRKTWHCSWDVKDCILSEELSIRVVGLAERAEQQLLFIQPLLLKSTAAFNYSAQGADEVMMC